MQFQMDSLHPTTGPPQVNPLDHKLAPLEDKTTGRIGKVSQHTLIQSGVQLAESSSLNGTKALDCEITPVESQFSKTQYETSSSVSEACDLFFNEDKIVEREKVDAAVDKVFNAIMETQNQSMEEPVEVINPELTPQTENSGEVAEEEDEVTPEAVKEMIKEGLDNLTSQNTDHHFIIADHEFHFSLISDIHDEHQIEIYQKIGELGQGAFGKVSEFKQLDTGVVYASKLASPKDGLPLFEAEDYYLEAQDLVSNAESQLANATNEEEIAAAETDLQQAKDQLENNKFYLDEAKSAEKDIKKEVKNQKLYNPDPHKPVIGIQPRYHKISTNLGSRYMIEKGTDGNKLLEKIDNVFSKEDRSKRIQLNKKIVDSLKSGLNYMTEEKGMCHSDIKPGNILCKGGGEFLTDSDFQIYHADFGADIPIEKIISKLSNAVNVTSVDKLMISSAAYTSSKIINEIDELSKSIHTKLMEGNEDIEQDQAKMRNLIMQSCKFSLGLTLFEMCIGTQPDIAAFEEGGILFGTNSEKASTYEDDLQVLVEDLSFYMADDEESRTTILNLLGLGTDFDILDNNVVLK